MDPKGNCCVDIPFPYLKNLYIWYNDTSDLIISERVDSLTLIEYIFTFSTHNHFSFPKTTFAIPKHLYFRAKTTFAIPKPPFTSGEQAYFDPNPMDS